MKCQLVLRIRNKPKSEVSNKHIKNLLIDGDGLYS